MSQKAFCVGINDYPGDVHDLNGCVNDARGWADLLVNHYDFPRSTVKLITDASATQKNIIAGIKDLLAGARSGDVLVFTNASHCSYIADIDHDEYLFDEVISPYDFQDNVVVDDKLRELFSALPLGVKFTVISDSCFSGTITRGIMDSPDERRFRFLSPEYRGDRVLSNLELRKAKQRNHNRNPESDMKEILITGCTDNEYSHDAKIEGIYHGAMSCFALQAIRDANYRITYTDLVLRINQLLDDRVYPQTPQLEGREERKREQIFV